MPAPKPPWVVCRCGRRHRTWNPHKVCTACVREARDAPRFDHSADIAHLAATLETLRGHLARERAERLEQASRVAQGGGEA